MYLLACVLGFSLERALETPLWRRLASNNEPCKESCDAGHDRECDQQDDQGRWTLSCDLHPTTSCDADCHYPPPPPTVPWLGASGTYPSPPPPPPPPDTRLLTIAWVYFVAALVICSFVILFLYYQTQGSCVAYWCCCLLPCLRRKPKNWDDGGDGVFKLESAGVALPAVTLKWKSRVAVAKLSNNNQV